MNALSFEIPDDLNQQLLDVSQLEPNELDDFFTDDFQASIRGEIQIRA